MKEEVIKVRDLRRKKTLHATFQRSSSGVEMNRVQFPIFQRGLGGFSLNGRIYDPLTAQFMQPDNYIQSPEDYISYNRYAYCRYNPFKYTDPSGEYWVYFDPNFLNVVSPETQGAGRYWVDNYAFENEIARLLNWMESDIENCPYAGSSRGSGHGGGGGYNREHGGQGGAYGGSQQNNINIDGTTVVTSEFIQVAEIPNGYTLGGVEIEGTSTPFDYGPGGIIVPGQNTYNASNCYQGVLGNSPIRNREVPIPNVPNWFKDPCRILDEEYKEVHGKVELFDVILYFKFDRDNNGNKGYTQIHIGFIIDVNDIGQATSVVSKNGYGSWFIHHPLDPKRTGTVNGPYIQKNGIKWPSFIIYRKK